MHAELYTSWIIVKKMYRSINKQYVCLLAFGKYIMEIRDKHTISYHSIISISGFQQVTSFPNPKKANSCY